MVGKWTGKKIAMLMGGTSKEREISLKTGTAISKGLRSRGYNIIDIDVGCGFKLVDDLKNAKPDAAVIALHGKFGEDGCIQGLLEMLRIPYTGGGVLASSVGMDKALTLKIAGDLGIISPRGVELNLEEREIDEFLQGYSMDKPLIVKPSREGSTINVTIVDNVDALKTAIEKASESDSRIIIEEFIKGVEVTVGVLNGRALPTLEIAPKSGFYDYESKYTKGMTEYLVPARISDASAKKLQVWSESIYRAIECYGTARCDYIVAEGEKPYFLEINTIPGMTELSLVPKAAAGEGMSFEDVCEELLNGAALKVNV
ncbi:MAG: D-alanine--D-alanine ligase [Deltaproteobacteria bacterium]|nr:D-alanine--D-alanine ligase [Deltaproteobacteria bacterium]